MRILLISPLLLSCLALATPSSANAEMVLSQVIVDLEPGEAPRDDIEVFNSGSERMYVLAEPFEVLAAGTPEESRVRIGDPSRGGLLVSPQRIVLAPGERRAIRVALTEGRPARERVYRIAIKPVAGELVSDVSAVKVMVGYDVLVLARPAQMVGGLSGKRIGQKLVIHNEGNASFEIFDGQQCNQDASDCRILPARRLYAGASWEQTLPLDTAVTYLAARGSRMVKHSF